MFREHARLFTLLQFVSDVFLTCVAFGIAYLARMHLLVVTPASLVHLLNPELHPARGVLVGGWTFDRLVGSNRHLPRALPPDHPAFGLGERSGPSWKAPCCLDCFWGSSPSR